MIALKAGTLAPDFTLPSTPDQKVSLSELRGKPLVLVWTWRNLEETSGKQKSPSESKKIA